jgi:hypothetical protein
MQHELGKRNLSRDSSDYAIHDPAVGSARSIVGRVVTGGLSDELADRRYLIVEGIDGRSHHVDVGELRDLPQCPAIVRITPQVSGARDVDRTMAEVAAANGGRYSVDRHLRHDPNASASFAATHVRRLEAMRRVSGSATREADGSWVIAPDHLMHAEAHERRIAERAPVVIETLSTRTLGDAPSHDGATWLDRELTSDQPEKLERGFGAEVRRALLLRQQWLIEQGLAEPVGDGVRYAPNLVDTLQRRELVRIGAQLSSELGLSFTPAASGERLEGKLARAVNVGDNKFALIERAHDFSLAPWKPALEQQIGKQVSGIMRASGQISWTIGRIRGLER